MPVLESKLRIAASLLGWTVLYYIATYVSLTLDDPLDHVGFVWFPAGIGVAAFLVNEYRRWPWLLAMFLIGHLVVDFQFSHDIPIALALSVINVVADMATAWLVRRYAQVKDDLQIVLRWVVATLVVSALAAVLGVGGLAMFDNAPFGNLVWVWWGAHVSGVLYLTAVIMGLRGFQLGGSTTSAQAMVIGVIAFVLMVVGAWLIFDSERLEMAHSQAPWRAAWVFAQTAIPIALTVIVAISGGNRLGSLALLCLGAIVIYHSSEGTGPFFLKSLRPGESLMLAQCYLVGTALLIVFLRVFTHSVRPYGRAQAADQEAAFMYRQDIASGRVDWDGPIHEMLGIDREAMNNAAHILGLVHPEDRSALAALLASGGDTTHLPGATAFRLQSTASRWMGVRATQPTLISDSGGPLLVGTWIVQRGGIA